MRFRDLRIDYRAAWQNAEEVRDMFKFSNQKTRQIRIGGCYYNRSSSDGEAGTILAGLMM